MSRYKSGETSVNWDFHEAIHPDQRYSHSIVPVKRVLGISGWHFEIKMLLFTSLPFPYIPMYVTFLEAPMPRYRTGLLSRKCCLFSDG